MQPKIPFETIIERSNDLVIVTEPSPIDKPNGPKITYVNEAVEQLLGYTREELIGETPRIFQGPNTNPETLWQIRQALIKHESIRAELLNYTKSGQEVWLNFCISPIYDKKNNLIAFASIERDITPYKKLQAKLTELASLDPLTGCLNRRTFMDLANSMTNSYIVIFDIDKLKKINDNFGHLEGDKAICKVADVCKNVCDSDEPICRYGGDEFVIAFNNFDEKVVMQKSAKIWDEIAKVTEFNFPLCVSAGLSLKSVCETSIEQAFKRADEALYTAKKMPSNKPKIHKK